MMNHDAMQNRMLAAMTLCVAICFAVAPDAAKASSALDDWRIEVGSIRGLAENDPPRAYKEAQRLQEGTPKEAQPSDKARILNLLSRTELYLALTGQAEKHAQLAMAIAAQAADKAGQAEAQLNLAVNAINQARIDASIDATTRSMELLDGVDRLDLLGEALLRLSMMYRRTGDFDNSVTAAMQAMEIAKRSNDPMVLSYAYQGLAISFDQSGHFAEARENYVKMREQARAAHSKLQEAYAVKGLAGEVTSLGDAASGERLMREAVALFRALHMPFNINFGLFGLADILHKQGRHAEALKLQDEMIAIYGKYPNQIGLWFVLNARSATLQSLGRIEMARADAESAYLFARKIGLPLYLGDSARRMAAIAAANGNHQRAYHLATEAAEMTDKAAGEKASTRMLQLAQRYQSESKQRQIDELNRRNEQQQAELQQRELHQRWLWTVFVGSLAILLATVYFLRHLRGTNRELALLNRQLGTEISGRKQMEDDLRIREQYQRALLDNFPFMVWLKDTESRLLSINRPYLQAAGLADDAPYFGKTDLDLFPAENAELYRADDREVMRTGLKKTVEELIGVPGKQRWHETYKAPVLDANGKLLGTVGFARDITERKRVENQLHVREQEFRAMVENSPDIIARYDTQCRRIYVNPAMQKQFGLPIKEILGKNPLELAALPDVATYMQRIQGVLQNTQESQMEFSYTDIQGGEHWGHMRLVPEFGLDGAVVSVLAITRDITEHKRAEEVLVAREREFRTLAENIPDNIIRYDSQVHRIFVNSAMTHTMGVDRTALIGSEPEEAVSAGRVMEIGEYKKKLFHTLESGESNELEITVRHAVHGTQMHNVRFVAERDAQNKTIGVLAIGRDITAQKMANATLREREQRYREIFDNATDGLYLLEVTENGRFRNLDINPALEKSTGIRREDMIGKFVDDIVSGKTARLVVEKFQRCVAGGKPIEGEIVLELPGGKRYYSSTIVPIYHEGRVHRLIGILRDTTGILKAEHELEESRAQLRGLTARREEAREEERKYIAREVHDELGQILTGLKLNISVLNHMYAADSKPLREHLLETMMLTDRSLEVARNVASSLRPAALDMGIVSALEWLTSRFASNAGIECEVRIADDELQLEENHAIALFRIVQESLTNISRYAKADKVVVTLDKDAADDYVLKVRDDGVGFDSNAIRSGTFGLVGIRERALMLGGTVFINSRPGEGTEIVVRIPARKNSEEL